MNDHENDKMTKQIMLLTPLRLKAAMLGLNLNFHSVTCCTPCVLAATKARSGLETETMSSLTTMVLSRSSPLCSKVQRKGQPDRRTLSTQKRQRVVIAATQRRFGVVLVFWSTTRSAITSSTYGTLAKYRRYFWCTSRSICVDPTRGTHHSCLYSGSASWVAAQKEKAVQWFELPLERFKEGRGKRA